MAKTKAKNTETETDNAEEMVLEKEWETIDDKFKSDENSITTTGPNDITLTDGDDGFDASDVAFPKLQIAQGVGPLSDLFPKGSIVLDKEMEIAKMEAGSVEITVLSIVKTFEENVPFGGDELPRIAKNKEEVLRLNGTTEWSTEDGLKIPPSFKPCADALICIKQPEVLVTNGFHTITKVLIIHSVHGRLRAWLTLLPQYRLIPLSVCIIVQGWRQVLFYSQLKKG